MYRQERGDLFLGSLLPCRVLLISSSLDWSCSSVPACFLGLRSMGLSLVSQELLVGLFCLQLVGVFMIICWFLNTFPPYLQIQTVLQVVIQLTFTLQAYVLSLCFAFLVSKIQRFFRLKVCGHPAPEQVYWSHFSSSIFLLWVSVSHFVDSHSISDFFIITFVMEICD